MELAQILMQQSSWTWNMMANSSTLGEMIREDALTSVNLTTINTLAKQNGIPLHTTSFQGAHLEREFGADWLWKYDDRPGYVIQAKRLDVVKRLDLLAYTFDMKQMSDLIDCAGALGTSHNIDVLPYYVLYNSMIPDMQSREQYMGCTCVNAYLLRAFIESTGLRAGQKDKTLTLQTLMATRELQVGPWLGLFP